MVNQVVRSLLAEPRPPDAPVRTSRDWAVVAVLAAWSVAEAALRHHLAPGPLVAAAALGVVAPQPWRRTHPLAAAVICFGTLTVVDTTRVLAQTHGTLLNSTAGALVIAYALFRWGSGREAATGLALVLVWLGITHVADPTNLPDTVAAFAFFLFATALGTAIRYRARVHVRDIDRAKAREREQLARELHDIVAHHVSGIAIQAQAGRAVAAADPGRAVDALAVIEDAATRTLAELRSIVAVLRTSEPGGLTPQPGLSDVPQLASAGQGLPEVQVVLCGELDEISPALGAAVYRLTQESITNARRHARQATRVCVTIDGGTDHVRLTIDDDGHDPGGAGSTGYGLVGMEERTTLLGGTFRAGPAQQGWRVEAVLPRSLSPR